MNNKQTRAYIEELSHKIKTGSISTEERAEFEEWYQMQLQNSVELPEGYANDLADLKDRIYGQIAKRIDQQKPIKDFSLPLGEHAGQEILTREQFRQQEKTPVIRRKLFPRIAAAAAVVLLIGTGLLYFIQRQSGPLVTVQTAGSIQPGGNKAYLTLSNGQKISLNDAANGSIAEQEGVVVSKTGDGQLVYQGRAPSTTGRATGDSSAYNTIETPNGGQYRVRLPDGTAVWLNAASSLTYPANFDAGNERRVQLSGEGYFEVARDKARPFIVSSNRQEVKVLGTHFNINAYMDEPGTRTTLLEGSVQVAALSGDIKKLAPGQQAELSGKSIAIAKADTESAIAWKNGDFIFNSDIRTIMRQISRWYDVEVTYQGDISDKEFLGKFSRTKDIREILTALELTERVHFKVEGRRITVMP